MNIRDELKSIILDLSNDDFRDLLISSNIIRFKFLKDNEITKEIYLEKLDDVLNIFELANRVDDNKLTIQYMDTLLSLVKNKTKKKTRADLYFNKMELIKVKYKKQKEFDIEDLKDFTRIFLCIYTQTGYGKITIENIDFKLISNEDFSRLNEVFVKAKKEKSIYDIKLIYAFIMNVLYLKMSNEVKEV